MAKRSWNFRSAPFANSHVVRAGVGAGAGAGATMRCAISTA